MNTDEITSEKRAWEDKRVVRNSRTSWDFPSGTVVKNLPVLGDTGVQVQSEGSEDPEKESIQVFFLLGNAK